MSAYNERMKKQTELADFAGGCFWHIEDKFLGQSGIARSTVGYEGGDKPQPTYGQVCSHTTGHAETVQLEFDPAAISYEALVRKYLTMHDPTQLNRQGADVGDNYRSAIFYHSPEQKSIAEKVITELNESGKYADPIVTKFEPATKFWPAEDYHQKYFAKQRGEL